MIVDHDPRAVFPHQSKGFTARFESNGAGLTVRESVQYNASQECRFRGALRNSKGR